jgi:hypothetical protein
MASEAAEQPGLDGAVGVSAGLSGAETSPAASASASASAPPPAAAATASPSWPDQALLVAAAFLEWLSRPRVRLAVIGVILLAIGGLFMASSVWTLPLVVVGALMVVIAWIGRRLDGRFALEWGETGTQLEFRAKIRAPQHAGPVAARAPSGSPQRVHEAEAAPERAQIIEGEAHTVEIDVAELEALIAAVENGSGEVSRADVSVPATRRFRVARGDPR